MFCGAVFLSIFSFLAIAVIAHNVTAVSSSAALSVDTGMTKSEVVEILGEPHQIDRHNAWHYSVHGCSDMLHVYFKGGKVESANF
nr:outer membrane protein assembly factor BamE [Mariniblastus fucicola]